MKYILVLMTSLYTSSLFACDKEPSLPIYILGSIVQSDAIKNIVLVQAYKDAARWYAHGDTIEPNYKILKISKYSTMLQQGSKVFEVALSNCNVITEYDNPHLYLAKNSDQDMYDENNSNTELQSGQSRTFSQPPEPDLLEIDNVERQQNANITKGEKRVFFKPPIDIKERQQLDDDVVTRDGLSN